MLPLVTDCERAAQFLLDSVGCDDYPVCPFDLADAWGFDLVYSHGRSWTAGNIIFVERAAPHRMRWDICHEMGHCIADHLGMDARDEMVANLIAAATLLPRKHLTREIERTNWSFPDLTRLFQVSWEVLARRIIHLESAVITIVDNGDVRWRGKTPWADLPTWTDTLQEWERILLERAARDSKHLAAGNLVTAYSLPSQAWHRVFLVAEAQAWAWRTASLSA
ncbi:MAG: ImmA/IrrE family metallo-endopeptidase [Myxococcota bacterium]